MQYLLMIYSEENGWNQMTDSERQQGVAAYQAYTESLNKAEALVGANRLQHPELLVQSGLPGHCDLRLGNSHAQGQYHRDDHHDSGKNLHEQQHLGAGDGQHHGRPFLHVDPDQPRRQLLRRPNLHAL